MDKSVVSTGCANEQGALVAPRAPARGLPRDSTSGDFATLCERLANHAALRPDNVAIGFVSDRGRHVETVTYADLMAQVQQLAREIAARSKRQAPVICLFEPGHDFVVGFLACLWCARIAVPVAPPRPNEGAGNAQRIISHSGASLILSTEDLREGLEARLGDATSAWFVPARSPDRSATACAAALPLIDELAVLQYTSGSTGAPKAVMISHGNLAANSLQIAAMFCHDEQSAALIWMPPQHDMGLVGGIVHPLYVGFRSYLMSPVEIIRSPFTWLKLMSDMKITTSGGPNFAFELCVNRVAEERRGDLDLSHWSVAFCGAEPISMPTLRRFHDAYEHAGLKPDALLPCYGLAEATLLATGIGKCDRPQLGRPREANAEHLSYVGCGAPAIEQEVVVVRPGTALPAEEGCRGEIWLRGPNVAQGYWREAELTSQSFGLELAGAGKGWLNTGDIGFLSGGSLHICGRQKAQIIVRGKNHSLEDIEAASREAHGMLEGCLAAAFEVSSIGLVIHQEAPRELRKDGVRDEVENAIMQRVTRIHGISPRRVRLVPMGALPRTRSGKIQRHLCVEA